MQINPHLPKIANKNNGTTRSREVPIIFKYKINLMLNTKYSQKVVDDLESSIHKVKTENILVKFYVLYFFVGYILRVK